MMIDPPQPVLPDLLDGIEVTHDHLLAEQVRITQPKIGYRVGNDAVLAAASLSARQGRVLDLGAGVGGISLCIAKRLVGLEITAVEIDPVISALARHNVAVNGMGQQVRGGVNRCGKGSTGVGRGRQVREGVNRWLAHSTLNPALPPPVE